VTSQKCLKRCWEKARHTLFKIAAASSQLSETLAHSEQKLAISEQAFEVCIPQVKRHLDVLGAQFFLCLVDSVLAQNPGDVD